jgi:pentatricopeptide repeat protein
VGNLKEAIKLFNQMKDRGHVPNVITYATILDALCKEGTPQEANRLLNEILEKL